jgi:hypothetical protein
MSYTFGEDPSHHAWVAEERQGGAQPGAGARGRAIPLRPQRSRIMAEELQALPSSPISCSSALNPAANCLLKRRVGKTFRKRIEAVGKVFISHENSIQKEAVELKGLLHEKNPKTEISRAQTGIRFQAFQFERSIS